MDFNAGNAKKPLEQFDFAKLFIEELGWNRHSADLSVTISDVTYTLRAVAEKRGAVAWVCAAPIGTAIPDRTVRHKIDTQVAKSTLEHLVIFVDAGRSEQLPIPTKAPVCNGIMPPGDSGIMAPPCNGMIPPGRRVH